MSEAPNRIWAFRDGPMGGCFVGLNPGEGVYVSEYIRADLVEAAIKRALEEAYQKAADNIHHIPFAIRTIDPAQFIEEPKG